MTKTVNPVTAKQPQSSQNPTLTYNTISTYNTAFYGCYLEKIISQ